MTDPTRQLAVARLHRARLAVEPVWLPVAGRSMGSAITGPGRVRVIDAGRPPRRGEIWAFVSPTGALVVHRFRSGDRSQYWFRGDANERDDPPVAADAVIGLVVRIEDADGRRDIGPRDRIAGRLRLDVLSTRRRLRVWWSTSRVRLTARLRRG